MDLLSDLLPDLRISFPISGYALYLPALALSILILSSGVYFGMLISCHDPLPNLPTNPPCATTNSTPTVLSVSFSPTHTFTKSLTTSVTLIEGLGVKGDAHLGRTVQHRSRLHITPPPPNLRQVHLIQNEVLQEFGVSPAEIGENITTTGIDLLALSRGTKLRFVSPEAAKSDGLKASEIVGVPPTITITGLRNPCPQIEKHREGLQERFIVRDEDRIIVARKAGVMSTVDVGGEIRPGMRILLEEPEKFEALGCV